MPFYPKWKYGLRPLDRGAMMQIGPEFFEDIEKFLRDNENSARKFRQGENLLVKVLAQTQRGIAMQLSSGVVDPQRVSPQAAWQIPVRRITSTYLFGWKVRKIGQAAWQTYNETREAFYIEYGIHQSGVAIRRPIRKRSLIDTLRLAKSTQVYERIWADIFDPRARGYYSSPGASFTVTPQV